MNQELFVYNLGHGLLPLDWEFCFLTVDEYKQQLALKYANHKEYIDHMAGGLDALYHKLDDALTNALADFRESFDGYADELRCPPMVFPIPRGDITNAAEFVIILKRDEDGDTMVYSPFPLPHLE